MNVVLKIVICCLILCLTVGTGRQFFFHAHSLNGFIVYDIFPQFKKKKTNKKTITTQNCYILFVLIDI
jgi:hypothetical protein